MNDMATDSGPSATPYALSPKPFLALARDIKLAHSVFALPFALLAMFLTAGSVGRLPSAGQSVLIVVCMVLARTVAMAVNRWADAGFDANNPRAAGRAIPSGRLSPAFVLGTTIVCSGLFIITTAGFWWLDGNPWPLVLSPLVLAYLAGYSFTKRFTWLCHVYLGTALALSPIAAVIAIEPGYLAALGPWLLALLVATWVAGFDIIYALQDIEVDRADGLYSMPSRLGPETSLWIARGLHLITAVVLLWLWRESPQLGTFFLIASLATIALLVLEHALVWGSKTNYISIAFMTVNGTISLLLGAAGIADIVL